MMLGPLIILFFGSLGFIVWAIASRYTSGRAIP